MVGVPVGRRVVAGPLDAAEAIELLVRHAREGRREAGDLVHDLGGVRVIHRVTQRACEPDGGLPVRQAGERLHHLAHARDAPFRVGERAVLFQERRAREEHMRVLRRLVQEQVLHDQALERGERGRDVLGVRVGLRHVLALHVHRPETAVECRLEHVRDAQAGLGLELHTPFGAEQGARGRVRHVPITGELVRERTHVARTLHVVLAAQRIHAYAFAADVARGHRQVGDAEHHRACPGCAR